MRDVDAVTAAVASLLDALKIPQEDRDRLAFSTPHRAAEAFLKATEGYEKSAAEILSENLDCNGPYRVSSSTAMLQSVKSIATSSTCMIHFQPMGVVVRICYIPAHLPSGERRTVPVGNLARLVKMYARRLTSPEIIAQSVAQELHACIQAQGVMVRVAARHHCSCGKGQYDDGVSLYFLGTLSTGNQLHNAALELVSSRQR